MSDTDGLFGPGIFGTGIDVSALDEDTALRLGAFFGGQVNAVMAERDAALAELATVKAERDRAVRHAEQERDAWKTAHTELGKAWARAYEVREAAVRPVVEAAREWRAMRSDSPTRPKPESALPAAEEVAPRVWAMPSEPGPDVTRVRDVYGQCFERADAIDENGSEPGWLGDAFTDEADVPDLFLSWKTLMAHHAPLTEVVGAAVPVFPQAAGNESDTAPTEGTQ